MKKFAIALSMILLLIKPAIAMDWSKTYLCDNSATGELLIINFSANGSFMHQRYMGGKDTYTLTMVQYLGGYMNLYRNNDTWEAIATFNVDNSFTLRERVDRLNAINYCRAY
jgi:opacity protein-like surface antigen